jgi:hypothetical protein
VGVTLYYPSTGTVTASVTLPYPAHNAAVECGTNQFIGRTASGMPFVHPHGGNHYRVTRTFESLTETQAKELVAFLRAIRFGGNEIRYSYRDVHASADRNVFCRIVYPTRESKFMRNMRDFAIVFEQVGHPDHVTDAGSFTVGFFGGGVIGEGVDPEPHITSALEVTAKAGDAFSYTITAAGAATITFGASGLPAWLSRTGAVLSGTPADGDIGDEEVTITATNGSGADSQTLTIRVDVDDANPEGDPLTAPVYESSGTLASVYEEDPVIETPIVTGTTPIVFTSADLPAWLDLDADTGEITGDAPVAGAGVETWTVTATNSEGFVDQAYSLTILAAVAPTITSPDTGSGMTSVPFEKTCTHSGGPAPVWTLADSPPSWLSIDPDTGVMSGTPGSTDDGTPTFDVVATNSAGDDTQAVTLTIALPTVPTITSELVANYPKIGVLYRYGITYSGEGPVTYSWSGSTPAWATLDTATGVISGTPTTEADYAFDITVTNDAGSDTEELELHTGNAPRITSPSNYSFVAGVGGTATPTATGSGTVAISIGSNTVPSSSIGSGPTSLSTTAGTGDVGIYGFQVTANNDWGSAVRSVAVRIQL